MFAVQRGSWPACRRLLSALLPLALLFALPLVACAPLAAPRAASTPTPPPTATAAPRILYQADWAQRASEWTLPPHWSIADGKLINDGKGFNAITIPYAITSQSYTLTIQMRVTSINSDGYNNQYILNGHSPSGAMLYSAGVTTLNKQNHAYSELYPSQPDTTFQTYDTGTADFTPGLSVRTYVLQVDGPYITFTLGGGNIGTLKSAIPLTPAQLDLLDQTVGLEIESLTITTP